MLGATQMTFTPVPSNQPQLHDDGSQGDDHAVPVSGEDSVDAEEAQNQDSNKLPGQSHDLFPFHKILVTTVKPQSRSQQSSYDQMVRDKVENDLIHSFLTPVVELTAEKMSLCWLPPARDQ
jgi:hypothetical protein